MLYGSQTGNAESIAKELSERLHRDTINNELLALNKVKGKKFQEDCLVMLVICSTTGNGDCPENADNWWRTVKLRSAVSSFLLVLLCLLYDLFALSIGGIDCFFESLFLLIKY